ncbi:Uncharacterised protein [Vibrio cholerae]|nr:Uncharacterised protein [Vibrio cholerae]
MAKIRRIIVTTNIAEQLGHGGFPKTLACSD